MGHENAVQIKFPKYLFWTRVTLYKYFNVNE